MICKNCNKEFTIYPEDRVFYNKMDVPEPEMCPACREMLRLSFYNLTTLYYRKCDLCRQNTLSIYHPSAPRVVYCPKCYWSDKWDSTVYGKDIDWNKSFFEQINELSKIVPHVALLTDESVEDSDYNNGIGWCKKCYMCFEISYDENCLYCESVGHSHDCVDCYDSSSLELSYECVNCYKCYHSQFLKDCTNCRDCHYSLNCLNCHDCFGSVNLVNKEYCWFNEQLSEGDYKKKLASLDFGSVAEQQKMYMAARDFWSQAIVRFTAVKKSENVTGNYIYESKNVVDSYYIIAGENLRYCYLLQMPTSKDCYDFSSYGNSAELIYESLCSGTNVYNFKFVSACWDGCSNLEYCQGCSQTKDCFASVNLRKGQFSILNKRYDEDQYFELKKRSIEKMKADGEYGRFFPAHLSPFGFNESFGQDSYHLTKEKALKFGFTWQDDLPRTTGKETVKIGQIPDKISDISEDFLKQVLVCEKCKKNYKVVRQEFDFYKNNDIPIPRLCFDCRREGRWAMRNPRKLWHRQCMCGNTEHGHEGRCNVEFETTYAPDRPEKVYCEECYRKEIY